MSREQPETVLVETHLLVEPAWARRTDSRGRPVLEGGKVVRATQGRPTPGSAGGVVVKVRLRVDASVFLPLQPEAEIHVHAGNAETIVVEAIDPDQADPDA